ncbi:hypothetical protein F4782DRAFT_503160 [Xylaria castorea]|nr:hypothetical protein F4782DRAFT_503160 [Xylaria castorea]
MSRNEIQDEETRLGSWPRRLLHVPTMTSYEWRPGNIYGRIKEPPYNAITYTWGRWRLKDQELPDVPALAISGVPWQVPRVKPSTFTAAQLHNIIQQATKVYSQAENPLINYHNYKNFQPTEFVWLDIACIDQRSHVRRSAAEVGRQAQIFHGARQVFVWLGTISSTTLEQVFLELEKLHGLMTNLRTSNKPRDTTSVIGQFIRLHVCLRILLSDPWFSSLWTLQEAYLRPDAVLFGRDAVSIINKDIGETHHILWDILGYCEEFFARSNENIGEPFPTIQRLLEDSGLRALSSLNGLATYIAANHRKTSREEDRVYGIQQIFRLRLGKSSQLSRPGTSYTRHELEIQLGKQLLRYHPVLSQLHVSTEEVPIGSGWFVSKSSTVPSELLGNVSDDEAGSEHQETSLCALSVVAIKGKHWGYFSGMLSKFSELQAEFQELEDQADLRGYKSRSTLITVHLNRTPELSSSPEYSIHGRQPVPQGDWQRHICRWLGQSFQRREDLFVLLLGSRKNNFYNTMLGLILLKCCTQDGFSYYRRVGLCWWDPVDELDTYRGWNVMAKISRLHEESFWTPGKGYFG